MFRDFAVHAHLVAEDADRVQIVVEAAVNLLLDLGCDAPKQQAPRQERGADAEREQDACECAGEEEGGGRKMVRREPCRPKS